MTTATKKKTKKQKLPTKIGEHEKVIEFDLNFKWPGARQTITFDGKKYQKWAFDTLPAAKDLKPMKVEEAVKDGERIGDYVFYLRPLPMWRWGSRYEGFGFGAIFDSSPPVPTRCSLEIYRGSTKAFCAFDSEIYIPILAQKQKYGNNLEPWMSLTPNEVLTQRGQIRRAKKDTAMAGLGLGWAARKVLERKQVKHLTVYEKSKDVLDYFGESLLRDYHDKLTLVCEDAYEVDWQKHDVALWDIWMSYGGASDDMAFKRIKREMEAAGKVCVGWGQGV